MKREEIINAIVEGLEKRSEGECTIKVEEIMKNNDVRKTALTFLRKDNCIHPNVYIDEEVDNIAEEESSVEDVVEFLYNLYKSIPIPKVNMATLADKQSILSNVFYAVINKEQNKKKLENVPYVDLLDLAIVYRGMAVLDNIGEGSFPISYDILKHYDITMEELDEAAKRNTEMINSYTIRSMDEVMGKMLGMFDMPEAQSQSDERDLLWLLSNQTLRQGASVLVYKKYFKDLAERVQSDLYVIPSSIHEVLALPTEAASKEQSEALKCMVENVNSTMVDPEEILSYNVYYYSRENNMLSIA